MLREFPHNGEPQRRGEGLEASMQYAVDCYSSHIMGQFTDVTY